MADHLAGSRALTFITVTLGEFGHGKFGDEEFGDEVDLTRLDDKSWR